MALTLSTSGITNSGTIQPGHVSQSIDALAGTHAYNLAPSGSLNVIGDTSITGTTTFVGTVKGGIPNLVTTIVTNSTQRDITMSADSNSVFILTIQADGNTGTNNIIYTLPRPNSVPGTCYKIYIGQIGGTTSSPATGVRPIIFKITGDLQLLLPSITTRDASIPLQVPSAPVATITVPANKNFTGDNYDMFSDGTYWYVTGTIATNSITYAS